MARLVIRIKDPAALELESPSVPREIIEYRWDRIVMALTLLILILAGAGWLLGRALTGPDMATATSIEDREAILADSDSAGDEVLAKLPPPLSGLSAQQTETQGAPEAAAAMTSAPATAQTPPATAQTPPAPAPAAPAAATPAAVASTPAAAAKKPAQAPTEVARPAAQAKPAATAKHPPVISLHSPNVLRAQLTSNVLAKQPVDQLGPVISMNGEGLIRVYLFTETRGLGGRPVFHHWYLNDRKVASVRLPSSDRAIVVSSSKFIDKHMRGDWRVEVLDDGTTPLITARFQVTD